MIAQRHQDRVGFGVQLVHRLQRPDQRRGLTIGPSLVRDHGDASCRIAQTDVAQIQVNSPGHDDDRTGPTVHCVGDGVVHHWPTLQHSQQLVRGSMEPCATTRREYHEHDVHAVRLGRGRPVLLVYVTNV